jgi:hypothetical protein
MSLQLILITKFILICLTVTNALDICTSRAVLRQTDEFYMTQSYSKIFEASFENYKQILAEIEAQSNNFKTNALKYDTQLELEQLEPQKLYPFTAQNNIIKVTGPAAEFMAVCSRSGSIPLDITPGNADKVKEILTATELESTPFVGFAIRDHLIARNGEILTKLPDGYDLKSKYGKFTKTGDIVLQITTAVPSTVATTTAAPLASTVATAVSNITGLCMKPNNYWDAERNRDSWLPMINKIIKTLPTLLEWKESITNFINKAAQRTDTVRKDERQIFKFSLPSGLNSILNFLRKYSSPAAWEASTSNDITDFQKYIDYFTNFAKMFKLKTNIRHHNGTEISYAVLPSFATDNSKLLKYLEIDSNKNKIAGNIKMISTQQSLEDSTVTVEVRFKLIDLQDKMTIFAIRPLIFKHRITSTRYLLQTFRKNLALQEEPRPTGCTIVTINNENHKVCENYVTSGLEQLQPQASLACGNSLIFETEAEDFQKCTLVSPPTDPLAYRTDCKDSYSLVISAATPLKIRVYCDTFLKDTMELVQFPAYLGTECEVKLINGDTERIIVPQIHNDFVQESKSPVAMLSPFQPVPVGNPAFSLDNTTLTLLIALPLGLLSFLGLLICVLYLFDPERCKDAMKKLCCCLNLANCCKKPCSDCCVRYQYPPDYEADIERRGVPRDYLPPPRNNIPMVRSLQSTRNNSIASGLSLAASAPPAPEENDALLKSAQRRQQQSASATPRDRNDRNPKHSFQ